MLIQISLIVADGAVDLINTKEAVAAARVASQKIDDVGKNISNLLNGASGSIGSTKDKSSIANLSGSDNSKSAAVLSRSNTDWQKNGTSSASKDTFRVNHGLVSILTGNDKLDDNISSSIIVATKSNNNNDAAAEVPIGKKLEGIKSTPSNCVKQTSIFESKLIQKQFEICSENASTISNPVVIDSLLDNHHYDVAGKVAKQGSISSQEFISTAEDSKAAATAATTVKPSVLDINICYGGNSDLIYFTAERHDANKTGSTTEEMSSINSGTGNVSSDSERFALQSHRILSSETATPPFKKSLKIRGTLALCDFVINFFKQV